MSASASRRQACACSADEQPARADREEAAVVDPGRQRPLDAALAVDEEQAIEVAASHRLAQKGEHAPVVEPRRPFVVAGSRAPA